MESARGKNINSNKREETYWKMLVLAINTILILQFFQSMFLYVSLPCSIFLILTKMNITKYLLIKVNL